jgi:enterochelin esterase-like enzyme
LQENVNVICVDWAPGAAKPDYFTAAANTDLVGKQISEIIGTINEVFGQDTNVNTHLIGWSLGGQVAGMAGYHLDGNLGRISGIKQVRAVHYMI